MSDTIKISATVRSDFGKGYARRIRMAGDIPAVIYYHGEEPKHVVLPTTQPPWLPASPTLSSTSTSKVNHTSQ